MDFMIELARRDGIATITLRRPEARNALTPSLFQELAAVREQDFLEAAGAGLGRADVENEFLWHLEKRTESVSPVCLNSRRVESGCVQPQQGPAAAGV